jgi:nitrite reductase/ring-hydroxylating ferredoxin subunit
METPDPSSSAETEGNAQPPVPRRRFLVAGGKAVAVIASLGVILAALRHIYPPAFGWLRRPRFAATFEAIAAVEALGPGEWKQFTLGSDSKGMAATKRSVWVRRDADKADSFRILSATCTHAGCIVAWKNARNLFVCPCHGGTFDADGNRTGGPPQRALAAVDYQVKDGQLMVRSDDV